MAMTEITRQHLEDAALAIGGTLSPGNEKVRVGETWGNWEWRGPLGVEVAHAIMRPHLDDGDAFRLAVRLNMQQQLGSVRGMHFASVSIPSRLDSNYAHSVQHDGTEPDKLRAAREAIVLCAAAVGERMREENHGTA